MGWKCWNQSFAHYLSVTLSLSGHPPKHRNVWWCADGHQVDQHESWGQSLKSALLVRHCPLLSGHNSTRTALPFLQGPTSQLKLSTEAYQLYLYELERMQGWSTDIVIHSFRDKCVKNMLYHSTFLVPSYTCLQTEVFPVGSVSLLTAARWTSFPAKVSSFNEPPKCCGSLLSTGLHGLYLDSYSAPHSTYMVVGIIR